MPTFFRSYPSGRLTGGSENQTEAAEASATLSPYTSSNSSGPAASEAVAKDSAVDVLRAPETESKR